MGLEHGRKSEEGGIDWDWDCNWDYLQLGGEGRQRLVHYTLLCGYGFFLGCRDSLQKQNERLVTDVVGMALGGVTVQCDPRAWVGQLSGGDLEHCCSRQQQQQWWRVACGDDGRL